MRNRWMGSLVLGALGFSSLAWLAYASGLAPVVEGAAEGALESLLPTSVSAPLEWFSGGTPSSPSPGSAEPFASLESGSPEAAPRIDAARGEVDSTGFSPSKVLYVLRDVLSAGGSEPGGAEASDANYATGGGGVAASTSTSASGVIQAADAFTACRSGAQGGGFDPATGFWAWTCGNYNWHATIDPTQVNAVYRIDCTGPGFPDPACKRIGEQILVGALHSAGVAADFTAPGGTVYWPLFAGKDHGIYVDRGAGLLADGSTRARIPPAVQLDVRARIGAANYAATGPSARRHAIQALNVRHLGEIQGTFELDDAGIPIRRGVWYVSDKGQHPDGNPATGADLEDGPLQNIEPATSALMVGSQRSFSSFNDLNYCDDSNAVDPRCLRSTSGDAFAGRMHWEYGTMSRLASIAAGSGAQICMSNFVGGDESLTTGTCPGDRRMRCWAGGPETLRQDGGCVWDRDDSGTVSGGDFDLSEGVGCQGFVDALEYDTEAKGRQLELGIVFDNCIDDPRTPADCSAEMGNRFRRVSIQDFIVGACAPDARAVFAGTGSSQAFVPTTTLAEELDAVETDVDLASVAGLVVGQSVRIDDELMRIEGIAGATLQVARGFSGTIIASHLSGAHAYRSITFNNTTTTWTPSYQVSGSEKVLAVSPARLLQAPGGFENVSIMPSDYRGSAACPTGTEVACDGTIGIAFNSGSGFYRDGTVLYPTFTGTNATFFDGSNLSEQVLVEDLRMYGPTRGGAIFDLADHWTLRRAIVEAGAPSSDTSLLSTFGDDITIEDSVFRNITTTTLFKFGLIGPQRSLVMRRNKFIGNGGGGGELINIGTATDFVIESNEFMGNAAVVPIRINPFRAIAGTSNRTYVRTGTIRNNVFSGNELMANAGEDANPVDMRDIAKASILIRDDESFTGDTNEITNLAIYGNTMVSMFGPPHGGGTVAHEDHPCLVWLEQDDEPASQMEESWPNIEIHSNALQAGVGGRVVCAGDTDAGYRNASASIDLFSAPHRPLTYANQVNGVAEPSTRFLDAWNFVVDAPETGDAFLLSRLPETYVPLRLDCTASGGSGLVTAEISIEECDGNGQLCAPIGAAVLLDAVGSNGADTSLDDASLAQGSWIKVATGFVDWAVPGTISCSLGVTR